MALPSAKPDKSSYGARADRERLPYLRLRWKSDDWRVYEVLLSSPLVISQKDADIVLEQFQSDELLLDVKRPGEAIVKVLDALLVRLERVRGAARRLDEGGRRRGGLVRLSTRFAPERLFQRGCRCDD